ncbi:MAG: S41 family peptidase [bacterium]
MKSTPLICIIGIMFVFVTLVFGQTQVSTTTTQTTDILHFQDVWNLIHSTFNLSEYYMDAEHRTDLNRAIPELVTILEQKGYHLKPVTGKKTFHFRTDIQTGACQEEYHLVSEDGLVTLDVMVYPDRNTAFDNYKKQVQGGPSFGNDAKGRATQILLPKDPTQQVELADQIFSKGVVVNLNWILPPNITWEVANFERYPNGEGAPQWMLDSLPGKKFSLSTTEYQNILHELKPMVDSFYAIAYLAIEQLVVPEDRVWMPKPGESGLSARDRITGFMYLWSEVKYNFANFDLVSTLNWERMKDRYLPLVETAQSDDEYYQLLQKLLAELHDGHTSLLWSAGVRPPIRIKDVEGKAVITDIAETDELNNSGLKKGMEIILVDGKPVKDIIEQDRYPYISASTPQSRDLVAYSRLLSGPRQSKVTLTVRDINGNIHEISLIRPGNDRGSFLPSHPAFEYRSMPGNITYIALNSFGDQNVVDQFDQIFDEKVRKAKGLIIDVRENQGGSTDIGYDIIGRLINKPLKGSKTKTRQYLPTLRAWGKEAYTWHNLGDCKVSPRGKKPYLGPVIVLTSPSTFSAGEDFLVPLKASKRAILVGERTGGSTGQPLIIEVGGGVEARICTKRDTYPDGSDFVGKGVIPDIEVHPTQQDIIDDKDRILDTGIAELERLIAKKQK